MITFQLKEVAATKDKNRHQLSLEAGVSYPTISKYWDGRDMIGVDFAVLDKLCEVLNCEPCDLIKRIPSPTT